MLAPTRVEAGCLNYDLHRSDDDPGLFFFHETWASADDHRAHLDTLHVRHLLTLTPDLLLEPIRELKARRIEGQKPRLPRPPREPRCDWQSTLRV